MAQHETALMKLSSPAADIYVPDGRLLAAALRRTTHLCLAAHQDDIEILAYHGISAGYARRTFTGVVITDGGGSPRSGRFGEYTDEQMKAVRRAEQRRAARLGHYAVQLQLAHPSAVVKDPRRAEVVADLAAILRATTPDVVYLHNPADRAETGMAMS